MCWLEAQSPAQSARSAQSFIRICMQKWGLIGTFPFHMWEVDNWVKPGILTK